MDKNVCRSFCIDSDSGLALPANLPFNHPQGHLRVDANVTVASVLEYWTRDGKISVLRHPDQVFHPLSLESLTGLPITISHPVVDGKYVDVTPDNYRQFGHGVTGDEIEDVKLTSPYVRIKGLNFQTKDSLIALKNGNKELSPGYYVARTSESGVYDNRSYTHRQYGITSDGLPQDHITYNHTALMDVGENGRSGNNVKVLNLDSVGDTDLLISSGIKTEQHTQFFDLKPTRDTKKMTGKTIKFTLPDLKKTGITADHNLEVDAAGDVTIPAAQIESIVAMLNEATAQISSFQMAETSANEMIAATGFDSLQAVVDGMEKLKGEAEILRAEIAKAPTVDSINSAEIQRRVSLITDAADLIPDAKESLASLSDRQIHEAVIKQWDSTKVFDGLSDEKVSGMYSAASDMLKKTNKSTKDSAEIIADNAEKQGDTALTTDSNSTIAANRRKARQRKPVRA